MEHVTVTQTGCIGLCQYEPIVEVYEPGKEKVTYVKVNEEKAKEILEQHLVRGQVLSLIHILWELSIRLSVVRFVEPYFVHRTMRHLIFKHICRISRVSSTE